MHAADTSGEVAPGSVFVFLAGGEHRLLPNDPFPFHFADRPVAIPDEPVAAQQLHRIGALVFYSNMVCKNISVLSRAGVCSLIGW